MEGRIYTFIAVALIALVLLTGLRAPALFKLGIENIPHKLVKKLQKKSAALISNQSGKDQRGHRSVDILLAHGITIKRIFAPEYGCNYDSFSIANPTELIDPLTGVSIINLYNKDGMRTLHAHMLNDIDALLFDLQDIGIHHHNYLETMVHMMQIAQQHNKMFVIFDRPNPLGHIMEGPLVDYKKNSYISTMPIPVRHGLTIGELAWYCNMYVLKHPANLVVVKMAYYNRDKNNSYSTINLAPEADTQRAYLGDSFLGFLREIRPFYVVSHTYSSRIMLPEHKGISRSQWLALAQQLEQSSLLSEYTQSYYDGCAYSGLKITVDNINHVSVLQVVTKLFNFCKDHHIALSFSEHFDRMLGTSLVRDTLQEQSSTHTLMKKIDNDLAQFYTTARASFMYMPLPQICN